MQNSTIRRVAVSLGLLCSLAPRAYSAPADCLRHRMQRGQTLAILARDYGVRLEDILASNPGVVPQHIPVGCEILLPPPPDGWTPVVTLPTDTLQTVCQRYSLLPAEVLQLNRLANNQLEPGQTLLLPRSDLTLKGDGEGSAVARTEAVAEPPRSSPPAPDPKPVAAVPVLIPDSRGIPPSALPVQAPAPAPAPARSLAVSVAAPPAPSSPPVQPADADAASPWVAVVLADGTRAWAPRASLISSSQTPLPPDQMLTIAHKFEGSPYRWGGQTPNGVDCSGFVQEVFSLSGHRIPRMADEQFQDTVAVTQDEARPGDLVFFTTYQPGPSHVGIFLGEGKFLHASSSQGVTVSRLQEDYYASRCLGIRRHKDWSQLPAVETSSVPPAQP